MVDGEYVSEMLRVSIIKSEHSYCMGLISWEGYSCIYSP
jgi:hypothetical protein